jgi:hypothetical protein
VLNGLKPGTKPEAVESSGTEKGEGSTLEAATKQRSETMTENSRLCMILTSEM